MSHIHEFQFVEKGGVQCSTLDCPVYYSEEQIIQILERIANVSISKHQNASDEPLESIEANECSGTDLTSRRFRRLFNEIYVLRESAQQERAKGESSADGARDCPNCHYHNTEIRCRSCGHTFTPSH